MPSLNCVTSGRPTFESILHSTSPMKYKEFTVTVKASSQCAQGILKTTPLQEYPPKQPTNGNTISTYIASIPGQQFSITVDNHNSHDASVVFYVDGQMASVLLAYAKPRHNSVTCYGVQPKAGLLRRFVFQRATFTGGRNSVR